MSALSLSVACILCGAQPTVSQPVTRWLPFIAEAAATFDVPAPWIAAVMQVESGGRTMLGGRSITSSAGAMGLMQIMPATYTELRQRYGLGPNPYDPHDNVFAGAAYLHEMYRRYGYPLLFAAYQAGPARVDTWLFDGKPLPDVTRAYLRNVIPGVILPSRGAISHGKFGEESPNAHAKSNTFVPLNSAFASRNSGANATITPQNLTANSVFVAPPESATLFVPLSSRNR